MKISNKVNMDYGDVAMDCNIMCKWCHQFQNDRTSVRNDQKSWRPSAVTDEPAQKVQNAVGGDHRLTSDQLP